MSLHHYSKTLRHYSKKKRVDDKLTDFCPFCDPDRMKTQSLSVGKTMRIVEQRINYDVFEGFPVIDHIMVIPIKHRESITEMTNEERSELLEIVTDYEDRGYHFFGRGKDTASRSVAHQHTHLIKIGDKRANIFVYVDKLGVILAK